MKNTKDRILDTSLELFNSLGLSKVTLRTIANKMGISQGNLNYHFKKREEIIETLYFQLVQNIDNSMLDIEKSKNMLIKAANKNHVNAQLALGGLLAKEGDIEEGIIWNH